MFVVSSQPTELEIAGCTLTLSIVLCILVEI